MLRRPFLSLAVLGAATALLAASPSETTLEKQLRQAEADAPGEVQLHIVKTYGQMSNFLAKVRITEKVEGWQQIRASGEAAFATWDSYRKDFVWRGGKFEVLFDLLANGRIRATAVTFDGQTSKIDYPARTP